MKNLSKCYIYFGIVLSFCILTLVNFFMTHNSDGLKRTKSYSTKLPQFYCYVEEYYLKECLNKKTINCDDKLKERNDCLAKVESLENDIRFNCWVELAEQYDCVKIFLD